MTESTYPMTEKNDIIKIRKRQVGNGAMKDSYIIYRFFYK